MTTEEAGFWRALDEQPDAHHLRLVFADWLQEQGDERAEGMRAIGLRQFRPTNGGWVGTVRIRNSVSDWEWPIYSYRPCLLPDDWFSAVDAEKRVQGYWMRFDDNSVAESAVALAFLRLPPERQAELLTAAAVG